MRVTRENGRIEYRMPSKKVYFVIEEYLAVSCRSFECRSIFSVREDEVLEWVAQAERTRPVSLIVTPDGIEFAAIRKK